MLTLAAGLGADQQSVVDIFEALSVRNEPLTEAATQRTFSMLSVWTTPLSSGNAQSSSSMTTPCVRMRACVRLNGRFGPTRGRLRGRNKAHLERVECVGQLDTLQDDGLVGAEHLAAGDAEQELVAARAGPERSQLAAPPCTSASAGARTRSVRQGP